MNTQNATSNGSAKTPAPMRIARSLSSWMRLASDYMYDSRHRVNTRAHVGVAPSGTKFADSDVYGSPAWIHLKLLFRDIGIGPDDVVLDYGCGSGRVLCAAALAGASEVVGIEMNPDLVAACKRNLSSLRGVSIKHDVFEGDAAVFEPEFFTHAFIVNSFGPQTLNEVLAKLEAVSERHNKAVTVVYLHPRFRGELDDRPGWSVSRTLAWKAFRHPAVLYTYGGQPAATTPDG